MLKFLLPLILLTSLFNTAFGQWKNENLKGKWIGTADFDLYPDLMFVDIDSAIKVKLFYHQEETDKVNDYVETSDSLKFIIDTPSMAASYRGEILNDSTIMGKFQVGYKEFDCNLIRLSPIHIADLGNLLGYFSFEDGRIIQIEPFYIDGSINPLRVLDFKNGKQRVLYPTYKDEHQITFAAGPKMASSFPTDFTITLYKNENGEAERLQYDSYTEGTSLKEGKRLQELSDFKDITVKNDNVDIEGTLTYPNVEDKSVPLVIYVPGAGEQFRGNIFDEYVKTLPYYGIATFVYDKRGCGVSTGDRKSADFNDLASDLKKVIHKLKKAKRIDEKRIGLVGFDQAGYVMPLAIENESDIKFIVNISGAMSKFVDQERQALEKRLRADEFTEEDIKITLDYQDELIKYLASGEQTEALTKAHNQILITPMIEYVTTLDETEYIEWWKKYYKFDAKPAWEKVKVPVLTLYGAKDNLLDPVMNQNRVQTFKNKSNFDTRILPNVNHLLIKGGKRGDVQLTEIEGYHPFLFKTINEWIGTQVGLIK
ncbi:S9 family peptidase [Flammeovirga sp. EKP202]|uniref:alpha/beta hydrolase family protein n=1 Tax=Flammeovirga sp. EKP202 TaxID=2770592 RepID=UPI00165FE3F4|nr:alpha/beta hydrolase [Flammeovirga sp. EKP202]MBD0405224.1 alpha/beta hydrolase [Flammeovirga sp. EKP202]